MDVELRAGLHELGLNEASCRVVALLPLVMVAWADNGIQQAERVEIERLAAEANLVPTKRAEQALARWLEAPMSRATQRIGLEVLRQLARPTTDVDWDPRSLDALLGMCYLVAEASGGMFGLRNPISAAEREVIADIAAQLSIKDTDHWQRLYLGASPDA